MSYPMIDGKTVLIDALKVEAEDFQLSNVILPSKKSIKAIHELEALTSDLLTFAKNPNDGMLLLPRKPKEPDLDNLSSEEIDERKNEYYQLIKIYQDQEKAFLMHVPYSDYMIIHNYLRRFWRTIISTRAIKGHMFYSFTKNEEKPENSMFSFLQKKSQQQQ